MISDARSFPRPSGTRRSRPFPTMASGRISVFFTKAGLYYSDVKPGELVEKGQVVGVLKNIDGKVIETIRSPTRGYPLLNIHNPVKLPGDSAITLYLAPEESY